VYGASRAVPYNEEQTTNTPLSPYAASKKSGEMLCHVYHNLYGIDVTVFRYFTVYGPAGRPDMLPFRLVHWISEGLPVMINGDGSQRRDFTYVDDIVQGIVNSLRIPGYQIINLGSDHPVEVLEAVRLVEKLTGRRAILTHRDTDPSDPMCTWADINRAWQLLGWRPRTGFEEGMGRLVTWYNENRTWARNIPMLAGS
jgi:nucleoside-diphosphate-sugar epimerase